jgi:hypothetical protein
MRKTFVANGIRHIVTTTTHISMLESAREGKYDSMKILLSSVKEEIYIHATVEQEENGAKLAAIGTAKTAIDREMMRLMGLIK